MSQYKNGRNTVSTDTYKIRVVIEQCMQNPRNEVMEELVPAMNARMLVIEVIVMEGPACRIAIRSRSAGRSVKDV